MHLQNATHALFLAACGVHYRVARIQYARVHAKERQATDEWIRRNLECKCYEGILVIRMAFHFIAIEIDALYCRYVIRCRHVVDDGIEQRLHALILER